MRKVEWENEKEQQREKVRMGENVKETRR